MKEILLLALAIFIASCSNSKQEQENFDPYPGGKATEKKAK